MKITNASVIQCKSGRNNAHLKLRLPSFIVRLINLQKGKIFMAARFRLTSLLSDSDKRDRALKGYYKSWRDFNRQAKSPFTALDNSFFTKKILKDLEPGPLKLYLYFSYVANNDYGHSWHSIASIAEYFGAQSRTIDNWIKVLVDKDLIYRARKENKSHNTYIIPFDDTLIHHAAPKKRTEDNQSLLEDLIKEIQELEFLYGEIIKVHHLFQWTIQKGKPLHRDYSIQALLIITKRKNGVVIGHLHILRKSEHLSVNELEIEDHCIFKSPFLFNGKNVIGIALTPYPPFNTRGATRDTIDLVQELANIEEWQLEDRHKLDYGNKDEVLPVINDDTDDKDDEEIKEINDNK